MASVPGGSSNTTEHVLLFASGTRRVSSASDFPDRDAPHTKVCVMIAGLSGRFHKRRREGSHSMPATYSFLSACLPGTAASAGVISLQLLARLRLDRDEMHSGVMIGLRCARSRADGDIKYSEIEAVAALSGNARAGGYLGSIRPNRATPNGQAPQSSQWPSMLLRGNGARPLLHFNQRARVSTLVLARPS